MNRGIHSTSGRFRDDRGTAAVELGLLLPLLLLIVFGIIQFALAYNAQLALTAGAREGVRALAINPGATDAVARTQAAAAPLVIAGGNVTTTGCPTPSDPTKNAKVTVKYDYNVSVNPAYAAFQGLMGLFGTTISSSVTLTGTGEMRCLG